jgi:hypothetical protein
MKHPNTSPQIEINWGEPEPFALIIQTAQDGDRIAAREAQFQADQQAAEKQQADLPNLEYTCNSTPKTLSMSAPT